MKTTGMGGMTTISANAGTVTISTTRLVDYRRLLRRLTAANRTVNDATHAEFQFPATPTGRTSKLAKALRALDPPDKLILEGLT